MALNDAEEGGWVDAGPHGLQTGPQAFTGVSDAPSAPPLPADDFIWAITCLKSAMPITLDAPLIAAYQAASSRHTLRALASDLQAFDLWCRKIKAVTLPATPGLLADYLDARAAGGSRPASLGRYMASIAKLHSLLGLPDPTRDPLVRLRLQALRRSLGVVQEQARPLRFKGPVRNVVADDPKGLNVRALLEAGDQALPTLRNRALLSLAYDTGLRAAELVAVELGDIIDALDDEARLLRIHRSKGDQEGQGATAYLSPRTVRILAAWTEAASLSEGPLFRRVNVRRFKAKPAVKGRALSSISGRERWDLRKTLAQLAVPARIEYDVGTTALHPGSIGPIFRVMITRAFDEGCLPDLTQDDLKRLLRGISAHSTRIGLTQDLFSAGEDLGGIMDALRWKSARMPLVYNRNLAAEAGAAGRLLNRLG